MSAPELNALQSALVTVLSPLTWLYEGANGVLEMLLSVGGALGHDGIKLLLAAAVGFALQRALKLPLWLITASALVMTVMLLLPVLLVKPLPRPEVPPYLAAMSYGMALAAGWRSARWWSWFFLSLGVMFFALPLIGMSEFSLSMRRGVYSFDAYLSVLGDPRFWATFGYSLLMALVTVVLGVVLVVPTAVWVRIKLPELRPLIEFITLLPLVVPAIVIAFGYIRLYNTSSWLPLTGSDFGTNILLTAGYVALALPYMYRAVDTGLRSIDIATMAEAAQSLGAGWLSIFARIILPNVSVAILSGAFLTVAIVLGEFTFAALLNRPAFGPYLQLVGVNKAYEPAALAVIAFAITWSCMGLIQLVTRLQKHVRAAR